MHAVGKVGLIEYDWLADRDPAHHGHLSQGLWQSTRYVSRGHPRRCHS